MLVLHKAESAPLLAREAEGLAGGVESVSACVSRFRSRDAKPQLFDQLCFASAVLVDEHRLEFDAGPGNPSPALAKAFCSSSMDVRFDGPWPLAVWSTEGTECRRVSRLEESVRDGIRHAMSRVAKLATEDEPVGQVVRGFGAVIIDPATIYWSTRCWFGGQRRMRDDPRAPSRSFLKCEEAYRVLGREPQAGETVADLGAAPGGWSYSAAKRGARVTAIDNGMMKGAAAEDTNITHVREDAFLFRPERGKRFDWLFCDMVESPTRVMAQLEKWVENRWCRWFVVNLKLGRMDPVALVQSLSSAQSPIRVGCNRLVCRELYHDRGEVTVVGQVG